MITQMKTNKYTLVITKCNEIIRNFWYQYSENERNLNLK